METLIWIYLINPILNATAGNYHKALKISTLHDSALLAGSADSFISDLYDLYHPIHLAFVAAFNAWEAQEGDKEGETLNLSQLLKLLSNTKIINWDIAIMPVFKPKTPEYKKLFPNGHSIFQSGKQEDRIEAVKALSINIGSNVALAAVKADIVATYNQLQAANTTQKGSKTQTGTLSKKVEEARVAMSVAQYADLGSFIAQYAANPTSIADYFDIESIRRHHQVYFEGHIKPLSYKVICKHTFGVDDLVKIINIGNTDLIFYLAEMKQHKVPLVPHVFPSLSTTTDLASILGPLTNKFIIVYNPNETEMGAYDFEIL